MLTGPCSLILNRSRVINITHGIGPQVKNGIDIFTIPADWNNNNIIKISITIINYISQLINILTINTLVDYFACALIVTKRFFCGWLIKETAFAGLRKFIRSCNY
jgi:hypothetical protein